MSRYTASLLCTYEGCAERGYFACDTRKEQREVYQRRSSYRCVRHREPDAVLSPVNPERETVLVAVERFDDGRYGSQSLGLFWAPEGSEKGGSGFAYGPGFKAFTTDFPAGTRLVITARVEIPSEAEREGGEA